MSKSRSKKLQDIDTTALVKQVKRNLSKFTLHQLDEMGMAISFEIEDRDIQHNDDNDLPPWD